MTVLSTVAQLAEEAPSEDLVNTASPIAFLVFISLAVATVLLWRSMNKHLRKVPKDLGEGTDATGPAGDDRTGTDADTAGGRDDATDDGTSH